MREIDRFDMRETESLSCAAVLSPETHLSRSKSRPVSPVTPQSSPKSFKSKAQNLRFDRTET